MPPRRKLVELSPGVVFDKLAFGSMQAQVLGMGDAELQAIAHWLTSPEARASAPADAAPTDAAKPPEVFLALPKTVTPGDASPSGATAPTTPK